MSTAYRYSPRFTVAAFALVTVTACGGGGSTPPPPLPPPATYSIGGTVSGLDTGESVVLLLNGGNDLTVSTNGAFTFATEVTSGGAYATTAFPSAVGKICTVTGGSGTASANVASVAVACGIPPAFPIGGAVSGLIGHGLELALQGVAFNYDCYSCIHFETHETVGITKNGDFVFATHLPTPQSISQQYRVIVQQQPQMPTQRCAVKNELGVIGRANVTSVDIVCGEFAYATNSTDQAISAFGIDATTGAMVSADTMVTGGLSPYSMASTPDKGHLYIGNSGSNNVSVFAVDPSNGALTAVPGSPFATGTNPRSLAVFSGISYDQSVGFFSYSYLYVANAGSDTLAPYQIDQITGVPTPLSGPAYHTGTGPTAMAIIGLFLYTANAGGSKDISGFRMDVSSGDLTGLAGSPFPSGSSVSSLAFGKFLYAADASGSTAAIYGFSADPDSGALTSLAGFPYPLPSCTFIVADQTGTYLYATTGTDLLGYRIDATTGALTALSGFPISVGAKVRSVSIDPTNQFLYVANGSAGTVTSFTLNAATGALTLMLGSPFAVGTSADYITTF